MKIAPNSNEATSSRFLLCPLLAVGGEGIGILESTDKGIQQQQLATVLGEKNR